MTLTELKALAEKAKKGGLFRVDFVQAATPTVVLELIERIKKLSEPLEDRGIFEVLDLYGPDVPLGGEKKK